MKRPKPAASVDELVAAGKYRKAIDLLRKQFSQQYPSTTERQGYAELLVRAGRGAEAVPVLLGIADEQERYGFPDKAIEAVRCAAAIDPEQAEVKERLEVLRKTPTEVPAADPATPPEDPPGAAGSEGAALDGALAARLESVSAEQEVPGAVEAEAPADVAPDSEFAILDGEDPVPLAQGGEQEAAAGDVGAPAPPSDQRKLVVVEDAGETTATSIPAQPGVDEEAATADVDDGEITARSIQVDPVILGEGPPRTNPDGGEITATSIHVDPAVVGGEQSGTAADDGEITARSIQVDPSVLGAADLEPAAEDDEITATSIRTEPCDERNAGEQYLLLPEDDLEPEEVEELTSEDVPEMAHSDEASPFHTGAEPETGLEIDAPAPAPESAPEADDGLRSLLTEEELDGVLAADAQALLSDGPTRDEPGPPEDHGHLDGLLNTDARALLSDHPKLDDAGALDDVERLDELLAIDARALLSDGPTRDGHPSAVDEPGPPPADGKLDERLADDVRTLFSGGPTGRTPESPEDPGQEAPAANVSAEDAASEKPEASALHPEGPVSDEPGAVADAGPDEELAADARNLLSADHPDETHLFLSEHDLLGALTAAPEPAARENESEDELDGLVRTLAEAGASGTALQSLPSETADPLQVAVALRTRYGSCDWSARVRLHLSGLMLEAGRDDDALDALTGVAEDLAQQGHGRGAIALLKKAGRLRHRGSDEAGERAALREGVEALLREAEELAARPAPAVEEEAERAGEEQGNQLAG